MLGSDKVSAVQATGAAEALFDIPISANVASATPDAKSRFLMPFSLLLNAYSTPQRQLVHERARHDVYLQACIAKNTAKRSPEYVKRFSLNACLAGLIEKGSNKRHAASITWPHVNSPPNVYSDLH